MPASFTWYARLMRARRIKCFAGGGKTLLFKGKRVGNAPTATLQRDAAPPRARALRLTAPTSPTRRTAHLQSCCPSAEHARDPRKRAMPETYNPAPKIKSLRQNSRPARTIPIKSRPAACTSGGINNFPVTLKGRPARSAGLPFKVVFSRRTVSPRPAPSVSAGGRWAGTWCGWRRRPGARRRCVPPGCRPWWSTACP